MGDAPASVRIDGHDIAFCAMGSGAPVVCSELPLNPFCRFTPLQRLLAQRYKVYVVDLRPLVDSAAVDQTGDLLDAFATTFLKTLDALEIDSCVLVGSFMFGGVAMEAARRAPSRIAKLVLIGTLGLVPLPRTWLMRGVTGFYRLPGIPALSRLSLFRRAIEWSDRAFLVRFRKKQLFYDPNQVPVRTEDLYQHYSRPRVEAAGWALMWCIRRLRYDKLLVGLHEVGCSTLIVHGTEDLWVPPRYATELQARLPQATIAWVPDTRHMPELEDTDEAFRAIQAFLDVPPAAAAQPVVTVSGTRT
jgi:pimeloyl-ACP methyl ester carboxylesterase